MRFRKAPQLGNPMPKTTNATAINPTPKKVNTMAVDRVGMKADSFRQHFEGLSGNGDGNKRKKATNRKLS